MTTTSHSATITLSADEMLQLCRKLLHLDPLPSADVTITPTFSLDVDDLLAQRLRAWYLSLLTTLPLEQLPLVDIAQRLTLAIPQSPLSPATVTIPPDVLRIHSIRLASWQRPAAVVPDTHPVVATLDSPYAPARSAAPVAVERTPSLISLHSPHHSGIDSITSCLAVIDPGPQSFILTPHIQSLLNTISPCTLLSSPLTKLG